MDIGKLLPLLLGAAWLLPLASFTLIVFFGPRMGKHGSKAAWVATGAILLSFVLSITAFGAWLTNFGTTGAATHGGEPASANPLASPEKQAAADHKSPPTKSDAAKTAAAKPAADNHAVHAEADHADHGSGHAAHEAKPPQAFTDTWYVLGQFGKLKVTISYYIDALTVCMFCMVTLIASCIHFYAAGYMHDELHDIVDHQVTLANGEHLHRHGRFHRFFQYLSLFCFSMLGLVIAGNIAMVFVFWELVGICSYFLIGFYIERKSASNAANKAFIVNRVGDFGMIIGLMALWAGLGTFAFGDVDGEPGIFSQVRQAKNNYELIPPDGMVKASAREEVAEVVRDHLTNPDPQAAELEIESRIPGWRNDPKNAYGYGLLCVAGLGIFCGCVGKSAQFPLHVWLPDAMEGPTPVSALVHSATMVAAGVYLVGRFYPVFTPEVLLTIAYIGTITLLLAATIAIVATDIKRVLAYSTVSQLGYMMLALGVGGWAAGMFHLITHAFFKSLLFMCSGSVIHACHTNEMTEMGGLRKKMPWTAYTMLVGCLAIAGAGIPFWIGFSGYYSKDAIIAQVLSFYQGSSHYAGNPTHGSIFFFAAAGGAAMTAFYMFRLWYLTFAGEPRDHHIYDHAHESPKIMYVPLVILACFALGVGWPVPFSDLEVLNLLEQARPVGELASGKFISNLVYPSEHARHEHTIHTIATIVAFSSAAAGFLLATVFYGWRLLSAAEVRQQFSPIYKLLLNKWYFDELYDFVFVRPTYFIAGIVSKFDKKVIDGLIDNLARWTCMISRVDDMIDRYLVDGIVNLTAHWTWSFGRSLRRVETGRLRQYVMFIVIGTVALSVIIRWSMAAVH
jgi:NADH:ubiquinone oxidoreductase subunit 5 (subunit L)/multisubunit Na+/H+ antiporter MnhA subunit